MSLLKHVVCKKPAHACDSLKVLVLCDSLLILQCRPPVPYMVYLIPGILVAFAAASWGYLRLAVYMNVKVFVVESLAGHVADYDNQKGAALRISTLVQPQNATTATVMFILVGCGILGNPYRTLSRRRRRWDQRWVSHPLDRLRY